MKKLIKFSDIELDVRKDDKDRLSLTDLWKLAGSVSNKDPRQWARLESTVQLIETVSEIYDVGISHILNVQRGKGKVQGTFAHKNIALAYAKYLDPKLHVLVNQNFFDRVEEEKNPDLIADRYVRTYKKRGMTTEWIKKRFEGVNVRNEFTATLKKHGVEHEGYRNATNAIYTPLYGGTSNVVREKKGLDRKDNIRDHLPQVELVAIQLAELMAAEEIESNNLKGNAQCELAAMKAGKAVANALLQNKAK
jgi:hypothetical protein